MLQLSRGRAWIGQRPDEWPPDLFRDADATITRTFAVPASVDAPERAVAIELKFQTGSPSFFARLGGHLTPGASRELDVTVRLPVGMGSPDIADIASAIEELPE